MGSRIVFVSFLIFLSVSAEIRALGESKEEPNRFILYHIYCSLICVFLPDK